MKVVVIGAGAAGMMAAISAAGAGADVTVLEKNEKAGKKIYITGKGRCNLTNACDNETFFRAVKRNPRFLYSSFAGFNSYDTIDAFEKMGLKTKVERGNRVFPESDKSSDVIRTLENEMKRLGVKILYNTNVIGITEGKPGTDKRHQPDIKSPAGPEHSECGKAQAETEGRCLKLVQTESVQGRKVFEADSVVIATGGLSYRSTGSTGDGYIFAKTFGHTVTPCKPSLVALNLKQKVDELEGLSLKNIMLTVTGPVPVTAKQKKNKKSTAPDALPDDSGNSLPGKTENVKITEIYRDFGEMLFTKNGISGPLVLSASSELSPVFSPERKEKTKISIDLKPALNCEQLDARVLRDFEENINKKFANSLYRLLPQRMADYVVKRSGIAPDTRVNVISAKEREKLVKLLKNLEFEVDSLCGFNEAVITCGGVNVKEVDPKTMESKLMPGIFFAGEVLDLDALTGGFNLQIAWTTGVCAGENAALKPAEIKTNTPNYKTGILSGSTKESTGKPENNNTNSTSEDTAHERNDMKTSEFTAIAIDGPAGAGKSTIAKKVAKDLGYIYVDTGAMYRAMAIHFIRNGIAQEDTAGIERTCASATVTIKYIDGEQRVYLNDEDVTPILRTPEVSSMASVSSAVPKVRLKLVELQRELARTNNVVMDGRDIGSYVLPDARVKVYMTASIEERARRRYNENIQKGIECDLKTIEKEIEERDYRDSHRDFAPLVQAEDAVLIDTSHMTIEEVAEAVKKLAK